MTLKVHRIFFFFPDEQDTQEAENFQVKSCGRTGSKKNIICSCNTDKHR